MKSGIMVKVIDDIENGLWRRFYFGHRDNPSTLLHVLGEDDKLSAPIGFGPAWSRPLHVHALSLKGITHHNRNRKPTMTGVISGARAVDHIISAGLYQPNAAKPAACKHWHVTRNFQFRHSGLYFLKHDVEPRHKMLGQTDRTCVETAPFHPA